METLASFNETREDIRRILDLCDPDNSNSISIGEFIRASRNKKKEISEILGGRWFTVDQFEKLDTDGSRSIDFEEFENCIQIFFSICLE